MLRKEHAKENKQERIPVKVVLHLNKIDHDFNIPVYVQKLSSMAYICNGTLAINMYMTPDAYKEAKALTVHPAWEIHEGWHANTYLIANLQIGDDVFVKEDSDASFRMQTYPGKVSAKNNNWIYVDIDKPVTGKCTICFDRYGKAPRYLLLLKNTVTTA